MKKRNNATVTADLPLLTYLPASNPSPLQVSTPQTPVTGILNTAVINEGTQPVYCNQVLIAVPVGTDPNCLFSPSPTPSASCNTSKWVISSLQFKSGEELGFVAGIQYAVFTFDCRAQSDFLINYNLVFGLQGQMTQIISDCTIQILENSGTTNDPNKFTQKQTSYTVQASTPQFYLQNFVATAPASPTVPATEFANGAAIQFSWESNGSFFQIYQKNVAQPIYAGTQTTFRLTGGVARDTTFFLVGMMSGNPTGDSPFGGYQPIYLYDALTVTISNPDLTPRSVAVSNNATVGGTLGVTGQTSLSNANVGGTLGVTGQTNLGNANVGGLLSITGQTNMANATVGGTLTANGQSNLKATNVAGSLSASGIATLSGGLNVMGALSMLAGAQPVSPGSYAAKTDGFLLGYVAAPPNQSNKLCITWIYGWNSDGVSIATLGGNVGMFKPSNSWQKWQASNPQSFLIPVRKNTSWGMSVQNDGSNEVNAPTSFWWIPTGSATIATFEEISEPEMKVPVGSVSRVAAPKDEQVRQLVGVIEKILGKAIDKSLQKEMVSVLLKLQVEEYETVSFDEGTQENQ